jgi:HlyD family secretion protein
LELEAAEAVPAGLAMRGLGVLAKGTAVKLVVVIVVIVALLAGGAALVVPQLSSVVAAVRPSPTRTSVRMEKATVRALLETVSAPGEIEPHTKVDISAEVSARIEQLPIREGEQVKQGDLIVKLDDRELRAELDSAIAGRDAAKSRLDSEQANLHALETALDYATRRLQRQQSLFETGDVAQKDLDDASERVEDLKLRLQGTRHQISVLESSLEGADADIRRAEKNLASTTMVAPMDGVLTKLNAEVGELVMIGTMNNAGTVILTVADLARMVMVAEVAENDIAKLKLGQPATVHINAYEDEVFQGTVREIALQRTVQMGDGTGGSGFFEVKIEIDLQGRQLFSGLNANADVEILRHEGVVVPSQAIVERLVEDLPSEVVEGSALVDRTKKSTRVVYRVIDGKAMCTPVATGPSDLTHTLVTAGLQEGEQVVIGPYKVLESIKHEELVTEALDTSKEGDSKSEGDEGGSVEIEID